MSTHVFASAASWIDGEAVLQLERTATLPGIRLAVGLPDLHPGQGTPIGAAFFSAGIIYPHLVGSDVGCGMALWPTNLPAARPRLDRWVRQLGDLDGAWEGDRSALDLGPNPDSAFDAALGTIGGGNHFAELQRIASVADPAGLTGLGLDPARLVLLVHSGSRGLGQAILNTHLAAHSASGLPAEGPTGQAYLARHDQAVAWAGTNRALIASRFLTALGSAPPRSPTLDLCHNSVSPYVHDDTTGWLHRKGAAPADAGPVVIAGSRGTLSYLVAPTSDQTANLATLAHGAGRKWRRSEARERLVRRYTPESLSRTSLGGRVICQDRDLIYEEAPQAYKNIDQVIDDLVGAGLVRVIATLSPLLTYKTRASRS